MRFNWICYANENEQLFLLYTTVGGIPLREWKWIRFMEYPGLNDEEYAAIV